MAENLPVSFAIPGENKLASYDFYDLAEGTGIVRLYGYSIDTGSGTKAYRFTTNSGINSSGTAPNYGATKTTVAGGAAGSLELNFDLTFNRPQTIKGKVAINVQTFLEIINPGSTGYFQFRLIKVATDGTTETAISSQITSETLTQVAGQISPFFAVEVPLTAITHFQAGERFRVEAILNYDLSASSTFFNIYHSPTNQLYDASSHVTTQFIALVPFVIDL